MPPNALHDPFWWLDALRVFLILHLMALAAWPWFCRLFPGRKDRGAGLAMAGGILLFVLSAQLLWRFGLFEIHFVWTFLLTAGIGISGRLLFRNARRPGFGTRARMRASFLQGWIVFTGLFWFWVMIRTADPGVSHTEQPMDAMWVRAAQAADHPPIRDAWFGGAPASYYADGHQVLALLGTTFGFPAQKSVNHTQIIWFALTGLLVFQAGKMLAELSGKHGGTSAGLISLLLVMFVSTPEGFFSSLQAKQGWWWWDASRVLQDGNVELITEFPFFSFWLGDNHAHLIALPLLPLALLAGGNLLRVKRIDFASALLPVLLVFWSWRINPWQVPTVLAIGLLCLLLRKRRLRLQKLGCLLLSLLPALLLLFPLREGGPEMALAVNRGGFTGITGAVKVFGFLLPGLFLLGIFRQVHRLCLILLLLLLGMFLCAEGMFLVDLFGNRMNTVFKIYYQIWMLAGLLAAVGWAQMLHSRQIRRPLKGAGLTAALLPGLCYAGSLSLQALRQPAAGLNAWNPFPAEKRQYLSVADSLIRSGERIAEAPGKSFDPESSLLGTWTAGNTLLGWQGHERQWRPSSPSWPELSAIYTATSRTQLEAVLRRLRVDWVAYGPRERDVYDPHPDWEGWMTELGYRVIDQPSRQLYRIR